MQARRAAAAAAVAAAAEAAAKARDSFDAAHSSRIKPQRKRGEAERQEEDQPENQPLELQKELSL